jgi:8-oxo-dGTP pyrophosphatase MutT (NUDIX family)
MMLIKGAIAILKNKNGDFLLQHRDNIPTIDNPNKIGLFGGAVEEGETFLEAIKRELFEELEIQPGSVEYKLLKNICIIDMYKDIECEKDLAIFEVVDLDESKLTLHEGMAIITLDKDDPLDNPAISDKAKQVLEAYRNGTIHS